ncbi:MAG: amidohydrolase family protein [Chitinophagales bacterium]|nr:amidohydrolase family protein [Chitinophagales bacterium]
MRNYLPCLLLFFVPTLLQGQLLIIEHTNVVDVKNGSVRRNVTVVIEQDRILAISSAPGKYTGTIIDGKNKYLIPGLWDMHTHTWSSERFFSLLLANGVTGIRDMFGNIDSINRWKEQIARGAINGPEIIASGPILDGPKPVWPGSVAVQSERQVAGIVDSLKNQLKVDFIKVYSLLPRQVFFKIADEAKKQQISFEGHVPNEVSVLEAARAGQKSQEHLVGIIQESSDSAAYLLKLAQRVISDTSLKDPVAKTKLMLRTFNRDKLLAVIRELKRYDSWICPTMVVNRNIGLLTDSAFSNDSRIHYMPPGIEAIWKPNNDFRFKKAGAEYFELTRAMFRLHKEIVGLMQKEGIRLLAGTDYPNPYCYPGFSLHDELALLVEAGLTPLQALQTATLNPAIYFNRTADLGTVEKGKMATLVLLNGNPLDNISNTKDIQAVINKGKLFTKPQLEFLLSSQRHE